MSGKNRDSIQERVSSYRARAERNGLQRVETTVSREDVQLIKDVAQVLRGADGSADELRHAIRDLVPIDQARTGKELVQFFRQSPWAQEDKDFQAPPRDRSPGRHVDLGE